MADSKDKAYAVNDLTDLVCGVLDDHAGINRFAVALSGGIDSVVLLHLLRVLQSQRQFELLAIHINHGLDKDADAWQMHCQVICDELGVELISKSVIVTKAGKGLEAAAREQRYNALCTQLDTHDALLTAHHQQDQAETLLLNLFRGSGVDGLAAMPQHKYLQGVQHIRPLLKAEKVQIESYAKRYKLAYINDPSNQDISYTRNYIRQKLLPELRQRWQQVDSVLSRTASNMGQASELLEDLAHLDLNQVTDSRQRIKLSLLSKISTARQKHVVRYWLSESGVNPTAQQLNSIFNNCIEAVEHANPEIVLGDYIVRRYRDCLYLIEKNRYSQPSESYRWHLMRNLELPEMSLLLEPESLLSSHLQLVAVDEVEVRFRQGGEKFRPDKQGLKKSLKKYFQEVGVPPWERDLVPLIYKDNELIAVWGYSHLNQ